LETPADKVKRTERRRIADEVLKHPIGKYSVPTTASPFEIAFTVRQEISAAIREGGK